METQKKDLIKTISEVSSLILAGTALIVGGAGLLASSTPILGVAATSSLLAVGIKLFESRQRSRPQIEQEKEIDWLNHHIQELSPDLKAKIINLGEALKEMEREKAAEKAPDIAEN